MASFSEYLADPKHGDNPVAMAWRAALAAPNAGPVLRIKSVSGVKRWFDDPAREWADKDAMQQVLGTMVASYTHERGGRPLAQVPDNAQQEWQAWVSGVLEGFDQRLAGIEAALTWLVDAQAGQTAAQQALADSRSVQDYRDWAGGDQTRSEAAALGLVTPAPGSVPQRDRSSVPGYEHVMPPTQVSPLDGVEPIQQAHIQPGIIPPNNSGLSEAIQAEAARIQAGVPADAPPGAYYDESAQVQQVRPQPETEQEWARPATQSYTAEQWRAWAMTSDIPGDEQGE